MKTQHFTYSNTFGNNRVVLLHFERENIYYVEIYSDFRQHISNKYMTLKEAQNRFNSIKNCLGRKIQGTKASI